MKKIISFENVTYSIPHSDTILEEVSFSLNQSEFFGVLGQNGAGKTTLIDLILGFREVTRGEIKVFDEDPHAIERQHREKVLFISQDVVMKTSLTVREHLDFHSKFYPKYSKEEELRLLDVFKLKPESKVGSLSTGQQKKVQIIAGFSSKPELILIDEITAVLDPRTRTTFFEELLRVQMTTECSIILATNIAEDLINRVQKVLFIANGEATIHTPQEIEKLFNLKKGVA